MRALLALLLLAAPAIFSAATVCAQATQPLPTPASEPEDYVRFEEAPSGWPVRVFLETTAWLFIYSDLDSWESAYPPNPDYIGTPTRWHSVSIPFIPAEATAVRMLGLLSMTGGPQGPAYQSNDLRIGFRKPGTKPQAWLWQTVSQGSQSGDRTNGAVEVGVVNRRFEFTWWKCQNQAPLPVLPNWPYSPSMGVALFCQGYYIPRRLNRLWSPEGTVFK